MTTSVRKLLLQNEKVLWSGRPLVLRFGWHNRILVLMAGGFLAMPLFWIAQRIWKLPAVVDPLHSIAFVLCLVSVGTFIAANYYAFRTQYILTNRRAIRITNYWRKHIDVTPIAEMGFCEAAVSPNGIGNIFYKITFKESFQEGQYNAGLFPEGFVAIRNADEVMALLLGLLQKSNQKDIDPAG